MRKRSIPYGAIVASSLQPKLGLVFGEVEKQACEEMTMAMVSLVTSMKTNPRTGLVGSPTRCLILIFTIPTVHVVRSATRMMAMNGGAADASWELYR